MQTFSDEEYTVPEALAVMQTCSELFKAQY